MNYLISIPNDSKSIGYKQTRPFCFEQIFFSESCNFTGTEKEFLKAGHGYAYQKIDAHTRLEVTA